MIPTTVTPTTTTATTTTIPFNPTCTNDHNCTDSHKERKTSNPKYKHKHDPNNASHTDKTSNSTKHSHTHNNIRRTNKRRSWEHHLKLYMVPRQKGGQVRKTTDGAGESIKSATSVTGLGKAALVCIWKCCPNVVSKERSSAGPVGCWRDLGVPVVPAR